MYSYKKKAKNKNSKYLLSVPYLFWLEQVYFFTEIKKTATITQTHNSIC